MEVNDVGSERVLTFTTMFVLSKNGFQTRCENQPQKRSLSHTHNNTHTPITTPAHIRGCDKNTLLKETRLVTEIIDS